MRTSVMGMERDRMKGGREGRKEGGAACVCVCVCVCVRVVMFREDSEVKCEEDAAGKDGRGILEMSASRCVRVCVCVGERDSGRDEGEDMDGKTKEEDWCWYVSAE